jgi:ribonuclease R
VDLDGRRIDFRLVTGNEDVLLRAMRDKTGQPEAGGSNASLAGKPRRGRSKEASSPDRSGALQSPPALEVKASTRKAAGKKTERTSARSASGKTRKSRR